jgi:hypothetical protein
VRSKSAENRMADLDVFLSVRDWMLTFAVYFISKHRRDPLVEPSAYFVARQELDHSWASGAITGEKCT